MKSGFMMDNIFSPPSPTRPPGPHHNASSIFTSAPGASRFAHEGLMPATPRNLAPITHRGKTPTAHHWAPRGSTPGMHQTPGNTPTTQRGSVSTMQQGRGSAGSRTAATAGVEHAGSSGSLGTAKTTPVSRLGKGDSSNGRKAESARSRAAEMRCGAVAAQQPTTPLQQRERTIRELRASLRDAHTQLDDRNRQLQLLKQQLQQLRQERAREASQHTEAELFLSAARGELAHLGKTVHGLLTGPDPPLARDVASVSRADRWRAVRPGELVRERRRQSSPCCRHGCCCCHRCGCRRYCVGPGSRDADRGSGDGVGYLCDGGVCGGAERERGDGRSPGNGRQVSTAAGDGFGRLGVGGSELALLCGDECRHRDGRGGGVRREVDLSRAASKPTGGSGEDGDRHQEETSSHGSWGPRVEGSSNGARNGAIAKIGSLLLAPVDVEVLLVAMIVGDGDQEDARSRAGLSDDLAEAEAGETKPRSVVDLIRRESSPLCLSLVLTKPGQSERSLKTMMEMMVEGRAMEVPRASCDKWQNGKATRRLIERALRFVWEACASPSQPLWEERPLGPPSVTRGQAVSAMAPVDVEARANDAGHFETDADNREDVFGIDRPSRDVEEAYGDDRTVVEKPASGNGKDDVKDAETVEVKETDTCDGEEDHVKDTEKDVAVFEDNTAIVEDGTTDFQRDSDYVEKGIKEVEEDALGIEEDSTNDDQDTAGFQVVGTNCDLETSKLNVGDILDTAEFEKDSRDFEKDATYFQMDMGDNTSDLEEDGHDFEKDVTSLQNDDGNIEDMHKTAADVEEAICEAEKADNDVDDIENDNDIATRGIEKDKSDDVVETGEAIIQTAVNVQKGKAIADTINSEEDDNLQQDEGTERETWDVQEDNRKNTEAVANQINVHLDTQDEQVSTVHRQIPGVGQNVAPDIPEEEAEHREDDSGWCVQATVAGPLQPDATVVVSVQQPTADFTRDVEPAFGDETFGSEASTPRGTAESRPAALQRGDDGGGIIASAAVPACDTSTLNEVICREGEDAPRSSNQRIASCHSAHLPPTASLVLASSSSSSSSSARWSNRSGDPCLSTTPLAGPAAAAACDREVSLVSRYPRPASEWSRWVALDWLAAGGPVLPGLVVWLVCRARGGDVPWRWVAGPLGGLAWPGRPMACGLMGLLRVCCLLGMSGLRGARRQPDDLEKEEPRREESESESRQ